jgi:hypothetical protein
MLSHSHANLINAVADFDIENNSQFAEGGARGGTISQILAAHFEDIGFCQTVWIQSGKWSNYLDSTS